MLLDELFSKFFGNWLSLIQLKGGSHSTGKQVTEDFSRFKRLLGLFIKNYVSEIILDYIDLQRKIQGAF